MINFSQEKNAAKALWDGVYKNQTSTLLWEEQKWVTKCARWLFDTVDLELKTKNCSCNLLDYACGNGVYFDYMKELSSDLDVSITGVDVSTVAIGNAKQKSIDIAQSLAQKTCHINVIEEPIFLPEEIGRCDFDVAICWSTIHHIDRSVLGRCIKGFYDSLQKDGLLIVSGWGQSANRYKTDGGRSPVTLAQCWPIGGIKSLLLRYFSIERHEYIPHDEEPDYAFEIFVCRKKNLTLLQRYENDLIVYLHDVGQDISFFHLYRYQISQNLMTGEMDRRSSFAFYRDESEMVETFARFVQQLRAGCGNKVFFFTKDIYSMRQKKHLIAFYDKGASAQNLVVKDTGFSTIYDFRLPNKVMADECHVAYKPIEAMTIAELYEKISHVAVVSNNSAPKIDFPDDFAERFYYGLNQNRDIGVYFFVCSSDEVVCSSDEERNTPIGIGDGGLVLYTKKRLSTDVVHMIDSLVSKWTATLTTKSFKTIFKNKAIQSAIGSIMSRNGSHNIGSHVLAALSHNVGTMPDDRVLYQYIQHRMDYIATATTEFPTWTQPTMVVGEMMKTLLSQRHLLDFITSSEGLKGWQFQNDSLGVRGKHEQTGCLRFHLRRIDKTTDGRPLEFIDYKSDDSKVSLEHDLALAIPGGIVGQHAFFTIIENVIRNAAKHDWSSPPSSTRMLKYRKSDGGKEEIQGNLDVYIDIEDRPEDGEVEIVIYTRMSDVFDGVELSDALAQTLKSKPDIIQSTDERIGDKKQDQQRLPLHDQQRLALGRSFIDSDGSLRRENWGLAEMKISAGYLQRREIAEIGGLDVDDGNNNATQSVIISPIAKKDEGDESNRSDYVLERSYTVKKDEGDDRFFAPVYHLAYKFRVPKPKLALFVSDSQTLPNGWKKVETQFKKYGIYACTQKDITVNDSLNYRYVILDSFDFDEKATCQKLNWRMPFRVISMSPTTVPDAKLLMPTWKSTNAKFEGCVDVNSVLEKLVISIDENARELLNDLAAQWSCYMQCRRFSEINDGRYAPIGSKRLLLQIETGDEQSRTINAKVNHHAGKSIITEADVVAYVFEECFDTMIDTFGDLYQNDGNIGNLLTILDELKVDRFKGGRMIEDALRERSGDYASLVNYQLRHWVLRRIIEGIADVLKDDFDVLRAHLDIRVRANESGDIGRMSYSEAEEAGRAKNLSDEDFLSWMEQWESAVQMFEDNSICARHPIDIFVEYVCAFCKQIKVYLSKYAEEIRTLPKGFSSDNGPTEDVGTWEAGNVDFWKGKDDRSHIADGFKYDIQEDRVVKYKRHFDAAEGSDACIKTNEGAIPRYCCSPYRYGESYIEPLSGTQCYLNSIDRIHISDTDNPGYEMMSRLVENSMLRILIVDERVAKFLLEHSSVISATYSILGIGVVDDKYVEQKLDEIDRAIKNNTNLDSICQKDILPIRKVDGEDFCLEKMEMNENAFLPNGLFKVNARNIHELRDLIQKSIEDEEYKCQLDSFVENLQTRFARTWDALIIHQGIIDKWFPALAHSSECMEKALDALRHIFPYVVITTGRGTPANIPSGARVLPFSTIETTLFKKYPEKLVLVDTIMGILPKGETQCKR